MTVGGVLPSFEGLEPMAENETTLPVEISIPVCWTEARCALLHDAGGRLIGTVHRLVEYFRCCLGISLSHRESLALNLDNRLAPVCSILISPGFPMQYTGADGNPAGMLKPKTFSVFPEFECISEDGKLIGSITSAGMQKVDFTCSGVNCCARFSKEKSRGLKPRQRVWELNADSSVKIDLRLILGFLALSQRPDTSG